MPEDPAPPPRCDLSVPAAPGFGYWDTLDSVPTPGAWSPGEPLQVHRRRIRVHRLERLAEQLDSGARPDLPPLAGELAAVGEDLIARRRFWRHGAVPEAAQPGTIMLILSGAFVATCPCGIMAALAKTPELTLLLLGAPWVAAGVLIAANVVTARRHLRNAPVGPEAKPVCRDCGQDLTGLPPAIRPEHLQGIDCGPKRCPECGAPWPMVPPPAKIASER